MNFNFEIDKKDLITPLKKAVSVAEEKGYTPILKNILMRLENNKLHLTCNDTEVEIKLQVKLSEPYFENNDNKGDVTVNAKKLFNICNSFPENAVIRFQSDEDKEKLYVKSGRSNFELATLPSQDYPSSPELIDAKIYKIESSTLKHQISKISFAMANGDARYYLNGGCINFGVNGIVELVSTDGHRLAISKGFEKTEEDAETNKEELQCIIPRKAIIELGKLLASSKEEDVIITVDFNNIVFDIGNIRLISKLIEGRYPDYNAVIPVIGGDNEKIVIAKTELMKQSLIRVMVVANDKVKPVRFSFLKDKAVISLKNSSKEEAEEEIDVDYSGEEFEIGFNGKYILDVLSVIDTDSVEFHFKDTNSSCLIYERDNDDDKYIVMPIRL
ncbi:DNA polymerase III subunit beta [Candidatus Woesearchaeota archaeon]|nr:DNA polymerase III subunit beta [Candidatus Woesearchaeota archaeon]